MHEQEDDTLGLRREVRRLGGQGISARLGGGFVSEQARQRDAAETTSDAAEHLTARQARLRGTHDLRMLVSHDNLNPGR